MELDLQRFLADMKAENLFITRALEKKIEDGFQEVREKHQEIMNNLTEHEKDDLQVQWNIDMRLKIVEAIASNAKWFLRAGITAFITFVLDLLLHHLGVKL